MNSAVAEMALASRPGWKFSWLYKLPGGEGKKKGGVFGCLLFCSSSYATHEHVTLQVVAVYTSVTTVQTAINNGASRVYSKHSGQECSQLLPRQVQNVFQLSSLNNLNLYRSPCVHFTYFIPSNKVLQSFPWWAKSFLDNLATFNTLKFTILSGSIVKQGLNDSFSWGETFFPPVQGRVLWVQTGYFIAVICRFTLLISLTFALFFFQILSYWFLLHNCYCVRWGAKGIHRRKLPSETNFGHGPVLGGYKGRILCIYGMFLTFSTSSTVSSDPCNH